MVGYRSVETPQVGVLSILELLILVQQIQVYRRFPTLARIIQ